MRSAVALATCLLSFSPLAAAADRIEGVRRIVAFADVHGAYPELVSVLREAGVVDEALRWQAGDTHLVSTGDLVDRGADSRKVMDLLMRLEGEAAKGGGAVHVLLGNHEVMNLVGDLRYVSVAEYASFAGAEDSALREQTWQKVQQQEPGSVRADFDALYPPGYFSHRAAFSPQGKYGTWLLGKPALLVVNDTAFVHAGLPPLVTKLGLEETNARMRAQLSEYLQSWSAVEAELQIVRPTGFLDRAQSLAVTAPEQAKKMAALQEAPVFTPEGPTWYRGQALCYPYTEADNLTAALEALRVKRVVVGHSVTPTGKVATRFDGRVILLDTGMLRSAYKGTPAALIFERDQWSVAYPDLPGQRAPAPPLPRALGARPAGLDDDALEVFLREAEVVGMEDLDTGITQPHRVTLRKDGIELRAVFKELSNTAGTGRSELDLADRFQFEIAAYKLDRLLGLDMVPVSVERTLGRRRGVLQFWIENAMNVRTMLEQKKQPDGWCDSAPQYQLMNVFDVLVYNTDRTQENALWTRDGMLVLIDHSRAFTTQRGKPKLLYRGGVVIPDALAARLATLNAENLQQAFGGLLHRRQIQALLARRDSLLKERTANR
jgi:hypothetical protein